MTVNPGKLVLDGMVAKLSDPDEGWNPTANGILHGYGLKPDMAIEFNSVRNFFLGDVAVGDLEGTTAIKFPVMTLFASAIVNDAEEKPLLFSGTVIIGWNMILSWMPSKALRDFEIYSNAIAESMIWIVNRARPGYEDQKWDPSFSVAYLGNIAIRKSVIKRGEDQAQNWYQQVSATLSFAVSAD